MIVTEPHRSSEGCLVVTVSLWLTGLNGKLVLEDMLQLDRVYLLVIDRLFIWSAPVPQEPCEVAHLDSQPVVSCSFRVDLEFQCRAFT